MGSNTNQLAGEGLKKIFLAQVLGIIGTVCILIAGIAAIVAMGGALAGSGGAAAGGAGMAAILAMVGGIVALISFIFNLIGLSKASGAHAGFKNAMMLVLINIVLSVVSSFAGGVISSIVSIAMPIVTFLGVYLVCNASSELLRGVGDETTAAKGDSVRNIYMICTVIGVVCAVVAFIPVLAGLAGLVSGITSIVQLVAMFIYMSFLKRAGDVLVAA